MKGSRTVASVDLMKDSRKLLPNESQHTLLLYKNELLKSVTAVKMFFYMYTECMDVINTPPPHTHTHPQGKHPTLGTHHAKFTNYTSLF